MKRNYKGPDSPDQLRDGGHVEEADGAEQDVQDAQEDSDAAQDEDGGLEMFVADQAQLVQAEAHLCRT